MLHRIVEGSGRRPDVAVRVFPLARPGHPPRCPPAIVRTRPHVAGASHRPARDRSSDDPSVNGRPTGGLTRSQERRGERRIRRDPAGTSRTGVGDEKKGIRRRRDRRDAGAGRRGLLEEEHGEQHGLGRRHVGGGRRRHGRPGHGREGGGHAQRDRLAVGLGELRQHHQDLPDQIRHHGEGGQPLGQQPGRGRRRQAAAGHRAAPRTCSTSAWPSRTRTRACSRRTRSPRGPTSPTARRSRAGLWYQDYGGYMAIGYDSAKFGTITSRRPAEGPKFKSAVALNGNPTEANAALNGVMMADLAQRRHRSTTSPRAWTSSAS